MTAFCGKCGARLRNNDGFCSECGAQIPAISKLRIGRSAAKEGKRAVPQWGKIISVIVIGLILIDVISAIKSKHNQNTNQHNVGQQAAANTSAASNLQPSSVVLQTLCKTVTDEDGYNNGFDVDGKP